MLVATVCPLSSSTDGWTTVGNQTELAAPHWADFNNWARTATSAELSNLEVVVVDIAAAAAEPGTNKWKAGYTNDGVHPNSGTGFPAIRSTIKDGVIAALKADF